MLGGQISLFNNMTLDQKPEPYKQDGLQVKIKSLESQIEVKLGIELLNRIKEYGFRQANVQAKVLGIDTIEDQLEREIAFSRLQRFKTEYTLMEVVDWIENLHSQGYTVEQIKNYFTPDRIAEVVCFE
jgi:hypothetical protein